MLMLINYLDIITLIPLIFFGVAGLKKGLINEVFSFLGLFLGIYAALFFSDITAGLLAPHISTDPKYINMIAFIATFVIVLIIINILGKIIARIIKAICLEFLDKLLGFIFGLLKGVLMLSVLIMVLNFFNITTIIPDKTKQESLTYPLIEQTIPYLYKGFDLAKETWQNNQQETPVGHNIANK